MAYDEDDLSGHALDYRRMEIEDRLESDRLSCTECHGNGNCPECDPGDEEDEEDEAFAPSRPSPLNVEITESRFPGAFCIKIIDEVNA